MRLFVAVAIPVAQKSELSASLLKASSFRPVRWLDDSSFHLTLKFLGKTDESQLPALDTALIRAAAAGRPFHLNLCQGGVFPRASSPRIFWIGVRGETGALKSLAGAVETSIKGMGFPFEERAYKAHLTVGRIRGPVKGADGMKLSRQFCTLFSSFQSTEFLVNAFSLYQSKLNPQGANYRILRTFPLGAS